MLDSRVTLGDTIDHASRQLGLARSQKKRKKVGRGIACHAFIQCSNCPEVDLRGTGAIVEMARDSNVEVRVA
jgi:hypothetical protein